MRRFCGCANMAPPDSRYKEFGLPVGCRGGVSKAAQRTCTTCQASSCQGEWSLSTRLRDCKPPGSRAAPLGSRLVDHAAPSLAVEWENCSRTSQHAHTLPQQHPCHQQSMTATDEVSQRPVPTASSTPQYHLHHKPGQFNFNFSCKIA